jgi:hypothetical protein
MEVSRQDLVLFALGFLLPAVFVAVLIVRPGGEDCWLCSPVTSAVCVPWSGPCCGTLLPTASARWWRGC